MIYLDIDKECVYGTDIVEIEYTFFQVRYLLSLGCQKMYRTQPWQIVY